MLASPTLLNQHAGSQGRLTPYARWNLRRANWQGFDFTHGTYLLHVPSSTLIEARLDLVNYLRTGIDTGTDGEELDALERELPRPEPRKPAPIAIHAIALNIIQSCNLRCSYCYAGDGNYGVESTMSEELAFRIIDFFSKDKKAFSIAFFGGEPLMNLGLIKKVVAYCQTKKETKFYFSMTTNGTLLNEGIVQYFKDHNFRITISYDGKNLHQTQRLNVDRKSNSQGMVESKLEKFGSALSSLRDFGLRATYERQNIDLLCEDILETLTTKNFKLTYNRHAAARGPGMLNMSDVVKLRSITNTVVDHLLADRQYDKLLRLGHIRHNLDNLHNGRVAQNFCGAGVNYLSVSTSGKFYLCHRFTEDASECVGDIDKGLDLPKLQQFAEHRTVRHDPCNACWMRQWCGGGCFHENKQANGTTFRPDPIFCALQDCETTAAVRVYTTLLQESPESLRAILGYETTRP